MKTGSESTKQLAVIGGLIVAALLVVIFVYQKAQAKRESATQAIRDKEAEAKADNKAEIDRKRAIQDTTEKHAGHLARYVNPGFERKREVASVAVAVASEENAPNPEVADALVRRFQGNDVQLLSAFFTPNFVADGFVKQIFEGRTDSFRSLELTNSLDAVLVGRQLVQYSTNTALENTITADLQFEVMTFPIRANAQGNSWKFVGKGVGFTRHEARMLAQERIIKQIADDTKLNLSSTLPRKP